MSAASWSSAAFVPARVVAAPAPSATYTAGPPASAATSAAASAGSAAGCRRTTLAAATLVAAGGVAAARQGRPSRRRARRGSVVTAAATAEKLEVLTVPASWEALREQFLSTDVGQSFLKKDQDRDAGLLPNNDAKVRYFGESREKPRVILYRDMAAWCPYCQKVWLLLEEKGIDYEISKVPMRSYGDKPDSFMKKVPRGLLPAIEIDGKLMMESLDIMFAIESKFPDAGRPMFPPPGAQRDLARRLLELERSVFGAWCGYLFRPEMPFVGSNTEDFERSLKEMDSELSMNKESRWFLPYQHPTIVDMQYVSHMERTVASALFYKGYDIRKKFPNIDAWLAAFEELPYYMASKSDFYTHCMDIPPQYGPPFPSDASDVKNLRLDLTPKTGRFPVAWDRDAEPLTKAQKYMTDPQRAAEAAWALMRNYEAIVKFTSRPAGQGVGDWGRGNPYRSELADPYARPGTELVPGLSALLLLVAASLTGQYGKTNRKTLAEATRKVLAETGLAQVVKAADCLEYLCMRVGVPRDMSMPAAKVLRATLNEVSDCLRYNARG